MKHKNLKIIASITVFFRMHDFCNSREARLSIIEYSMQKLDNPYLKINTNLSCVK